MSTEDKPIILLVEDNDDNRRLVSKILGHHGYQVIEAIDGKKALKLLSTINPDLILMDIKMPVMDGFEVARLLQKKDETREVPIIFITAKTDVESKVAAFHNGGVDYVTKPFNKEELLARVKAQLRLKNLQDELRTKNRMLADKETHLTHLVDEKVRTIEKMTLGLVTVLEDANLANDDETGNHIRRVSNFSAVLAETYGTSSKFVKRISMYASLHDVGKVGIADAILKKPGRYTPEEFVEMQQHVVVGHRMMDNAEIDPMASNIAYYHHEKWNGSGYVNGL
ncbi:response regulator, partial [bacterium]|nr:response regulator [bacterium]